MNWIGLITNEWRLKLLALGLAVLMLGAVAFSQNPPAVRSVTVTLSYIVPPNVVLLNPPVRTAVSIRGLADTINRVDESNIQAIADASGLTPGNARRLTIKATTTVRDVQVQDPAPIVVTIDSLQDIDLPVVVNVRAANGWNLDPSKTLATCPGATSPSPCKVRFTGPVSWETNLKAVATFPGFVVGKSDSPNQPISLQNANGTIDLTEYTVPRASLEVSAVNLHAESIAGSSFVTVPLVDAAPSKPPPAGYRVTAITITPSVVTITGDSAALQRIRSITLDAVDLSDRTSDATFEIAIRYPTGVSGSADKATIKYTIARNPNVP